MSSKFEISTFGSILCIYEIYPTYRRVVFAEIKRARQKKEYTYRKTYYSGQSCNRSTVSPVMCSK